MKLLRELTVKQGLIIIGAIIGILLLIVIITSLNRRAESVAPYMTNTPSISFDNLVPDVVPTDAP